MTTTTTPAEPRPARSLTRMVVAHTRLEVAQLRRSTETVISVAAIPALLYAMFAMSNDSTFTDGGAEYKALAVGSFSAYGVLTLGLFAFGSEVARERARGWLRTMRATPVPMSSYITAKLLMGMVYVVLILAAIAAVAFMGGADVTAVQWAMLGAVLVAGVIPFSALGFAIAFLARPRGASAVATLAFLPLSFASGFFVPLSELPDVFRDVAPWLPTYHFGQVVWRVVGTDEDAAALSGLSAQPLGVHLAWVAGMAAAGLIVAVTAARREAVSRRS